jgi:hypothetical protein
VRDRRNASVLRRQLPLVKIVAEKTAARRGVCRPIVSSILRRSRIAPHSIYFLLFLGGIKQSGIGSNRGEDALRFFTESQNTWIAK